MVFCSYPGFAFLRRETIFAKLMETLNTTEKFHLFSKLTNTHLSEIHPSAKVYVVHTRTMHKTHELINTLNETVLVPVIETIQMKLEKLKKKILIARYLMKHIQL